MRKVLTTYHEARAVRERVPNDERNRTIWILLTLGWAARLACIMATSGAAQ